MYDSYFEWDQAKDLKNGRKHGLRFDDVVPMFDDPDRLTRYAGIENGEERWQTIGMLSGVGLVFVAHTLSEGEDGAELIRLISARLATPKESRFYYDNRAQNPV